MNPNLIVVSAQLLLADFRAWIERQSQTDRERGSHTSDVLLWTLAIIGFVTLAVGFLTGYINKIGAQLLGS